MGFSPKASTYVVVVGLNISQSPDRIMQDYWKLRHELYISPPTDVDTQKPYRNLRFHAAEDPQVVRNKVFELIAAHLDQCHVHAVILEKADVFSFNRSEDWLYESLYYFCIRSIWKHSDWIKDIDSVQLMIDQTQVARLRAATSGGINRARNEFGRTCRVDIHHISSLTHPFQQLVDYFAWAIFRKYERKDLRSYSLISKAIEYERTVFKNDLPG